MKAVFAQNESSLPVQSSEINIINRREIMPLLAKARQVLGHYERAMGCSAAVLDSSGRVLKTLDSKKQLRLCEFCMKQAAGASPPCADMHSSALAESRRTEAGYVYACAAGFVFWTSPLYRNGRYVGALTAGQVILAREGTPPNAGHAGAQEKFRGLCRSEIAVQKFSVMAEDVPEKNREDIKAMAEMLGLCAEEISERKEAPGEVIRRKAWQSSIPKSFAEPQEQQAEPGKNAASGDGEPRRGLLEKERMLIAAFRRGDNETGGKILKELMGFVLAAMPGNLEATRFRAIELVVLLSRAALTGNGSGEHSSARASTAASGSDPLLEVNNRYLGRILESKTAEEMTENLYLSAERMASKIFSFQGMRHASALRRAERYIWENYTRKLSLEEIAKASGLSAPYFSTIFKEEMGENLSSYLNRLRVERTVTLLTETGKSLNEIAKLCGFEDQSWFSKIFKSFTGISPGKFRENGGGKIGAKPGKEQAKGEVAFRPLAGGQTWWRMPDWDKQEMLSS